MVDGHAIRRGDAVLPLTPMFHVNGWGLPYTAALAPASLVLAGADTSPASVGRLIESERPTTIAGIPTFWVQMAELFDSGDTGRLVRPPHHLRRRGGRALRSSSATRAGASTSSMAGA